ncbi:MAG: hypothetical protein N3E51_03085 [Candidatus Micrarchaeota archaeon]|nr:hypothetical protein [Candidatus Micrarchaeota archaeon]
MDGAEERTVIISSRELVEHAVLSRKRNELAFKKDLLVKSGAKEGDLHLKAVCDEIAAVEEKLAPIGEKLAVADLISIVPKRKEIAELTEKINRYSRPELERAVRSKEGEAYELMKRRAVIVRENYERREDIARLTILLNTLPRKEAESLRAVIEEGSGSDVDVSFLPKEKQQQLLNLASRLGRDCCIYAGSFSVDKKKVAFSDMKPRQEVERIIMGRRIWIDAAMAGEFDENEKALAKLLSAIQAKGAEKQARELSGEENAYFEKAQHEYLSALSKRAEFMKEAELGETAKVYKKESWRESVGDGY